MARKYTFKALSLSPREKINAIKRMLLYRKIVGKCWNIEESVGRQGYPRFPIRQSSLNAHRIVFAALVADIPKGMVIDHLCNNRLCVNPSHLECVTSSVNAQRSFLRGRPTVGLTDKEYHKEYSKKYYQRYREKLSNRNKEYNEKHKVRIAKVRSGLVPSRGRIKVP